MIVHTLKMCTFYFVHFPYFSFTFLTDVELHKFFPSVMLRGCLVCVICNPNSIYYFIFKLCIMIVHTLMMCTSYFLHISWIFFSFLGVLNLDIFSLEMLRWFLVCVICNSKSFHFVILKFALWFFIHWTCASPFCANLINIFFLFLGMLKLDTFSLRNA